ncbi:protein FAM204A-like [Actinia tenebrosa]|uniref:Protein FAM204A-like n=1 Tax=Actinia tenebrosa TaxID=6105 RepID=A0A6P8H6R6_ACTTE|nr:protein FAM204A-like [Actinia tenebrosa]
MLGRGLFLLMYTAVAPPKQTDDRVNKKVTEEGGPPAGVSENNWKKFQELKKRREQCCKKSKEKRKKERRKNVIKPVSSQVSQEELTILTEYGVPSTSSSSSKTCNEDDTPGNNRYRKTEKIENEAKWRDLKQYLYLPHNSGLESEEKIILKKQTEEQIDKAIAKRQFEKAELLSEKLSTQDFVVKVASAVEGRNFAKRRSEEQSRTQEKKKAKLHWGFEQKQRWESKGNM